MKLHGTMNIENQQLFIGGVSCQTLVNTYQTPLYVFDEALLRQNCKDYRKHFKVEERGNRVAYAGKAFLPLYMCHTRLKKRGFILMLYLVVNCILLIKLIFQWIMFCFMVIIRHLMKSTWA